MKKIYSILTCLILTASVIAQAPQKMSYQAVIRNNSGILATSIQVGMKISILQGTIAGSVVYAETQTASTNANGLVSIEVGTGTVVTGTFAGINWASGPYFIKTETDLAGGTNYTIEGTNELMSVPYALFSANATGGFTHYIGEQFGGGVVFHLWKDNQGAEHGLIVAVTNQSTQAAYSNVSSTLIGLSAQSNWDGLSNSNAIIAQAGHTSSAAKVCLDLVSGGQSDWYLPAFDELNLLWQNRFNVGMTLSTIGGATLLANWNYYWCSTEDTNVNALGFNFAGNTMVNTKSSQMNVRAIRAF